MVTETPEGAKVDSRSAARPVSSRDQETYSTRWLSRASIAFHNAVVLPEPGCPCTTRTELRSLTNSA